MAVAGRSTPSSGTARAIQAVKVFEFGPGQTRIFVRVGVLARGLVDALDELVHPFSALLGVELGLGAEPAPVGLAGAHDHDRLGPAQAPANDLVDRPALRVGGLDREPGVHAENPFGADGAGAVDLDHRLLHERRIRGEAHRLPARVSPILRDHRGSRRREQQRHERIEGVAEAAAHRSFEIGSQASHRINAPFISYVDRPILGLAL